MHNLSCENEFYLHENEKSLLYQRLSTYPCFDTEAKGNSEMVYYYVWLTQVNRIALPFIRRRQFHLIAIEALKLSSFV